VLNLTTVTNKAKYRMHRDNKDLAERALREMKRINNTRSIDIEKSMPGIPTKEPYYQ
jgi:hypothetical protein